MKKRKTPKKQAKYLEKAEIQEKQQQKNQILSLPQDTSLPRKKAVSAYLLAGVSFFYCLTPVLQDQPIIGHYDAWAKHTVLYANFLNTNDPYSNINKKNPEKKNDSNIKKSVVAKSPSETEKKIRSIVKNTPMERMVDAISKRDKIVAAYLVGIAMKESKFGVYSPKKNGRECYNYWGYRGRENQTASGYSCFSSPEEAVRVVGNRIEALVDRGADSPAEMIVWKCGSTCAGHSPESVRKWIADVNIHFYQINKTSQLVKK